MEVVYSSHLDVPEIVINIGVVTINSKVLVKYQKRVVENRWVYEGSKEKTIIPFRHKPEM